MNILIISDTHIGDGGKFSSFGWTEDKFIQILKHIKNDYQIEKIILNGDIYELYKFDTDDIEAKYQKLIAFLEDGKNIYIKGNHDAYINRGLDFYQIINSKGKTIHIEHGHNADFMNGTKIGRLIGKYFFHFLKILTKNKYLLKRYFDYMNYHEAIDRIPRKYNRIKYLSYALKLLQKYDLVVLGHTHKLEIHRTYYLNDKKTYINTGTCSLGRFQAVVLDTESLKYTSIKLRKKDIKKYLKAQKQIKI